MGPCHSPSLESEGLLERATRLGARAMEKLRAMKDRQPLVADVRGIGLLLGIELADPASGAPARTQAEDVMYRCLAKGLSFKVGQGNVLTLVPPLVIEEADLDRALEIVEQAIAQSGSNSC